MEQTTHSTQYLQKRHRVEQSKQMGHSVDKVEFIFMELSFCRKTIGITPRSTEGHFDGTMKI